MLTTVFVFYCAIILFSITALWTLIQTARTNLLFFYIPLVIALVVSSIFVYDSILGRPKPASLPVGDFAIIQYIIDEEHKAIYVWIIPPGSKDFVPIAYQLPYTKQLHKKMDQVKNAVDKGTARAEKKSNGKKKTNSSETSREEDDLNTYDFTELKFPAKE
jgi:hypothetical protein